MAVFSNLHSLLLEASVEKVMNLISSPTETDTNSEPLLYIICNTTHQKCYYMVLYYW